MGRRGLTVNMVVSRTHDRPSKHEDYAVNWFRHFKTWLPGVVSRAVNYLLFKGSPLETLGGRAHRMASKDAKWASRKMFINKAWNFLAGFSFMSGFMLPSDDHCHDRYSEDLQAVSRLVLDHGYRLKEVGEPVPEIDMVDV